MPAARADASVSTSRKRSQMRGSSHDRVDGDAGHDQDKSANGSSATVSRLTGMLAAKGMRVFAVIDQSAEASAAGPASCARPRW